MIEVEFLFIAGILALASITAFALASFFVTRFFLGALVFGAGCCNGGGGVGAIAGERATIGDIERLVTLIRGGGVGVIFGILDGGRAGISSGVRGLVIAAIAGDIGNGAGGTLPGPDELTSMDDDDDEGDSTALAEFR